MPPIKLIATVQADGRLIADYLPYAPGQQVEVLIYPYSDARTNNGDVTHSRDVTHVEFDVSVEFPDSEPPAK